ncbi:beta strand repeat-containing protein [Flavobacterium aestivum]|uniref:beta strand repeat-containing protein n=1 Tax=Flavobacterium aestivum TaxID=3003257 RepID=UPI0024831916|nr:Ig-like domain-containing protein [Flavobacterium aestivum]
MKLSHTLVYSILSFFISTVAFSQDQSNTKKGTGTVSTNGASGCTNPVLPAISGGSSSVCVGGITPYFNHSNSNGVWSIVNGSGTATIYTPGMSGKSTSSLNLNGAIGGGGGGGGGGEPTGPSSVQVKGLTPGQVQVKYTVPASGLYCAGSVTQYLMVNAIPVVSITGPNAICVNATTQLSPTTGGTWTSSNPAVATVSNTGMVTGVTAGTATFTFTATGGCTSLATPAVTVNASPAVSIIGNTTVCLGSSTQFSSSTPGGSWSLMPSDREKATVNSTTGIFTGILAGSVLLYYSGNANNGCSFNVSTPITINAAGVLSPIAGSSTVCVGSTTQFLNTTSGGIWLVNDSSKATINSSTGILTGVSAGSVEVTYRVNTNGCSSTVSKLVTVNASPAVSIVGNTTVCVGSTAQFSSATSGGTWSVPPNDRERAIVSSTTGSLTGILAGSVQLYYSGNANGCPFNVSTPITIKDAGPSLSPIAGSSTVCVGSTAQFSNTISGGIWSVNDSSKATINSSTGILTGVLADPAPVEVTYRVTTNGCSLTVSKSVTVDVRPAVSITGANTICVNATTQLSAITGGTWASSNPAVATVNNAGVVTGVTAGTATFTFTATNGCTSSATPAIAVNALPSVSITESNTICINTTTQLSPTTGGTWTSSNPAVATVSNAGMVTGVTAGTATFIFTATGGCASLATSGVTVNTTPIVSITGPNAICINTTTQLSPSGGGTWVSSNPAIATVSNVGVVTGVSVGTATFTFTGAGGCISLPTSAVTVNTSPTISAITGGATKVCIGATTQFANITLGGVWSITNGTGSATIDSTGLVTALSSGTVQVNYMVDNGTCKSYATPQEITISPATTGAKIDGPDTAFIGSSYKREYRGYPLGGTWSVRNASGTATIQMLMGGTQNNEYLGMLNASTRGTVKVIYTYNDPCGSVISLEKEVTILESCTLNNPNSLIVKGLYEKLLSHLYDRVRRGDTNAQINGSTPAELIALRPYIKNSLADKIYNFNYYKYTMWPYSEGLSFSFSPGDIVNNDVQITNGGLGDYTNTYVSYNTVSKNSVSNYIPAGIDGYGGYDRVQSYAIKNIDFCPTVICAPMSGSIKTSIASPTTADSINFSFETTATNLSYKWTFKELDNLTPKGSATTPVASQTFSIPGNYRVLLFAKDGNGCEGNFYTDVIVKQTCVPIVGKIKILQASSTSVPVVLPIELFRYEGSWQANDESNNPQVNSWVDYLDINGVQKRVIVGPIENGCKEIMASKIVATNGVENCVACQDFEYAPKNGVCSQVEFIDCSGAHQTIFIGQPTVIEAKRIVSSTPVGCDSTDPSPTDPPAEN